MAARAIHLKQHLIDSGFLDEKKSSYIADVLHPAVHELVRQAVQDSPAEPFLFFLEWLLNRLRSQLPGDLVKPLLDWFANGGLHATPASPGVRSTKPRESNVSFLSMRSEQMRSENSEIGMSYSLQDEWDRPVLSDEEMAGIFGKVALFHGLSDDQIAGIASHAEWMCFNPQDEIVSYGAPSSFFHYVYSGKCDVSVPTPVSTLSPGECIGQKTILRPHLVSKYRISAMDQVITLAVSRDNLEKLSALKAMQRNDRKRPSMRVMSTQAAAQQDNSSPDLFSAKRSAKGQKGADSKRGTFRRQQTPAASWQGATGLLEKDLDNEKSADDVKLITDAVRENANLMDVLRLSTDQIKHIVGMVESVTVPTMCDIVKKGKSKEHLYIVHDGIFVILDGSEIQDAKFLGLGHERKLRNGQSCNELSLLYNTPSQVTIRACRNSVVWMLTKEKLDIVMSMREASRMTRNRDMLKAVPLLRGFVGEERMDHMAVALEELEFQPGEEILAEGAQPCALYIVGKGQLEVGDEMLKEGDYFGVVPARTDKVSVPTGSASNTTVLVLDESTLMLTAQTTFEDLLHAGEVGFGDAEGDSKPTEELSANRPVPSRRNSANCCEVPLSTKIPKEKLRQLGTLGAGSFGLVTLEEHVETHERYALKAMSKGYILQQGMKEMVLQEKRINSMLKSPYIVRLHGVTKDEQFLYFLLDPVLCGDLFDCYNDNKGWFRDAVKARFYSAGVCLALQHMHSHKIVFRDLKLENILLHSSGHPKLADMGLAKQVVGMTYTVCGTADYMAPEMLRRTGHNRAVDYWALGILIYVMMSGQSPFDADDTSLIYRNVVKGFKKDHFKPFSDKSLIALISALCRKEPEDRAPMGPKGIEHLHVLKWYKAFDWSAMADMKLSPPWVPSTPSLEEILKRKVEVPPMLDYEDDGTGWDDEF